MNQLSVSGFSPIRHTRVDSVPPNQGSALTRQWIAIENPDSLFDEELQSRQSQEQSAHGARKGHSRPLFRDPALKARLAAEMLRANLHKSQGREAEEKLDRLRQRMSEKGLSKEARLQAAAEEFEDVSDQYQALLLLLREQEEQGEGGSAGGEASALLEEALAELEMGHGEAIRAGIHCLASLPVEAGSEEVTGLRTLYRGSLEVAEDLGGLLAHLLKGGAEDLDQAVARLRQATGDDLASGWPSHEPALLHALNSQLYRLEVINSVRDHCRLVAERIGKQGKPMDANDLLKNTVDIVQDTWAGAARFETLADRFAGKSLPVRISFLVEVKGLVRELPVKLFSSPENRIQLVDMAQGALDRAIEQEDEAAA